MIALRKLRMVLRCAVTNETLHELIQQTLLNTNNTQLSVIDDIIRVCCYLLYAIIVIL